MSKPFLFILATSLIFACSSPKKTSTEPVPAKTVSKTDIFKGGTSYDNAVVIRVTAEAAGIREEYNWLSQSYPGYRVIRKREARQDGRVYHIITFKTREGEQKIAYFDVTSFSRKK